MMNTNIDVGKRLDEEIFRVFGTKREAAKQMELSSGSYFNAYTSGKVGIGVVLLKRLQNASIDIGYVKDGVKTIIPDAIQAVANVEAAKCSLEISALKRRIDRASAELADISKELSALIDRNS